MNNQKTTKTDTMPKEEPYATYNQNVIKHKSGLLNLAEKLRNISKACKMMGYSRETFYRYQAAKEEGGVEALLDNSQRKPNLKNRVEKEVEDAVVAFATSYPAQRTYYSRRHAQRQGSSIL